MNNVTDLRIEEVYFLSHDGYRESILLDEGFCLTKSDLIELNAKYQLENFGSTVFESTIDGKLLKFSYMDLSNDIEQGQMVIHTFKLFKKD